MIRWLLLLLGGALLGGIVHLATVIVLPRTATRDAARIAGLDVLRIINEPTAASLASATTARSRPCSTGSACP